MNEFYFIINNFLNGNYIFRNIELDNNYYLNSKTTLKKLNINELSYNNIITKLNKSNLTKIYFELLKDYKYELIVNSDVHGLSHIIRTSILLLIISVFENINDYDFKLILESVLYHDIGRVNDIDDEHHGFNATKKISFLKEKYNDSDYNLICSIITGHSLDDEHYKKVANFYKIEDIDRYYKLLCIVKDADALDRVREYPYVDIKYLRTVSSKRLLCFAYELYYNYEYNLKN